MLITFSSSFFAGVGVGVGVGVGGRGWGVVS